MEGHRPVQIAAAWRAPACLRERSSPRDDAGSNTGALRTVLLMWRLRGLHFRRGPGPARAPLRLPPTAEH